MAPYRKRQIVLRHAVAVIDNDDLVNAATDQRNRDAAGVGIKGVFDKLLQRACRAFDDFPRRDLVDQRVGKHPDHRHGVSFR